MIAEYQSADELNTKYYKGKLLTYTSLLGYVQEFNEAKADLDLKKTALLESIPAVWDSKEIVKNALGDSFVTAMSLIPTRVVYMWLWPVEACAPYYTLGNYNFYHAPMYIGEGTIHRALSHCIPSKDNPVTPIQEHLTDFIKKGQDPHLFILAKDMNTDMVKLLEADVIAYFKKASHFTRGLDAFQFHRSPLNVKREASHEGKLLDKTGSFIKLL